MSNPQERGRVVTCPSLENWVTWEQGLLTHPFVTLDSGPLSERLRVDLKHIFTHFYGKPLP